MIGSVVFIAIVGYLSFAWTTKRSPFRRASARTQGSSNEPIEKAELHGEGETVAEMSQENNIVEMNAEGKPVEKDATRVGARWELPAEVPVHELPGGQE